MSKGWEKRRRAMEEDYFQKHNRELLENLQKSQQSAGSSEEKEEVDAEQVE